MAGTRRSALLLTAFLISAGSLCALILGAFPTVAATPGAPSVVQSGPTQANPRSWSASHPIKASVVSHLNSAKIASALQEHPRLAAKAAAHVSSAHAAVAHR